MTRWSTTAGAAALLLVAGCSGSSAGHGATVAPSTTGGPTGSPAAGPSATAGASGPADPYTALVPGDVSGPVGSFGSGSVQRAELQVQGLLAGQLLDPVSAGKVDVADLTTQLTGALPAPDIARDLRTPSRASLRLRVAFAARASDPTVLASHYVAVAEQGLGGEAGLGVRWDGQVRYTVPGGTITYGLSSTYVFAALPEETDGVALQVVVPGSYTAAPADGACAAKGLLALPGTAC